VGWYNASTGESSRITTARCKYLVGDQVIKKSTHLIYQATTITLDDPEVGVLLDVPTWIEVSPTNKYKPFDVQVSSQSTFTGTYEIELLPGDIIGSISAINLTNVTNASVVMTDPVEGVVYSRDVDLQETSLIVDWFAYLWTDIEQDTEFIFLDLPPYSGATTKITFTGVGELGVGLVAVGPVTTIGEAVHGGSVQEKDFSSYEEDTFGNLTITRRNVVKLVNYEVRVHKVDYPAIYKKLTSLKGLPAVWVGTTTDESDFTLVYGIARETTYNIDTPTICKLPITVRGFS